MDFQTSVQTCFRKYAVFQGRAARSEYWWFALALFLVALAVTVLDEALGSADVLPALFAIATFLPTLAVQVRRLHDINRSGWWVLLGLIPLIGFIILVIWFIKPGDAGPNRFGSDPRAQSPPDADGAVARPQT